jgi:uncharacterized membrane protein YgcG
VRERHYGEEVDIWSLGMVLFELMALDVPFREHDRFSLPNLVAGGNRPAFPPTVSAQTLETFRKVFEQCTERVPGNRPTAVMVQSRLHRIQSLLALKQPILGSSSELANRQFRLKQKQNNITVRSLWWCLAAASGAARPRSIDIGLVIGRRTLARTQKRRHVSAIDRNRSVGVVVPHGDAARIDPHDDVHVVGQSLSKVVNADRARGLVESGVGELAVDRERPVRLATMRLARIPMTRVLFAKQCDNVCLQPLGEVGVEVAQLRRPELAGGLDLARHVLRGLRGRHRHAGERNDDAGTIVVDERSGGHGTVGATAAARRATGGGGSGGSSSTGGGNDSNASSTDIGGAGGDDDGGARDVVQLGRGAGGMRIAIDNSKRRRRRRRIRIDR